MMDEGRDVGDMYCDYEKPPLGLHPRKFREWERMKEILEAMLRYVEHGNHIPQEWLDELHDRNGVIAKICPDWKRSSTDY